MGEKSNSDKAWIGIVNKYNSPDNWRSVWQILNSVVPYMVLWYLMYRSMEISYLITLGLAIVAAGFLVRIFIIFHDCGHGSFFKSSRVNRIAGTILGSFSFTPYERWHYEHSVHHATVGNLDKRGIGDVMTLTVEEYRALPLRKKIFYRAYRNPVIIFGIAPFILFVIWFRFSRRHMRRVDKIGVYITNIIIAAWSTALILLMGWKAFLLIQMPVIYIASSAGVWLFYLQHQFEEVIWARQEEWDYRRMAMEGSSFLRFPRILQWFSGNIGFHHIHHLSPMIPNYNLERCHVENSMFHSIKPITFLPSLKNIRLRLWDEATGRLVSFTMLRKRQLSV